MNAVTNARDVSKTVGILVWDCIINLSPFSAITEVIDVLRDVSRLMPTKADWRKEFTGPALRDLQTALPVEKLISTYGKLALNPWRSVDVASERETETSTAGVLLSEDGHVVTHFAKRCICLKNRPELGVTYNIRCNAKYTLAFGKQHDEGRGDL